MAEFLDLAQAGIVRTVADGDCVFVETGGSVARVGLEDFVGRMAGDSAEALKTLKEIKEALAEGNEDAAVEMLNKIAGNTAAIETLAAKDGQFTVEKNYVDVATGKFVGSNNWISTPILPLNKAYDLILHIAVDGNGGIAFYDAAKQCISGLGHTVIGTEKKDYTVLKSDFPSNAMYFAASTMRIESPSWSNGPTREAREGAAADAIAASKLALFVDEWLTLARMCSQEAAYDATKGNEPFMLNQLWMSYEGAQTVKGAGALRREVSFFYSDRSTLKTNFNALFLSSVPNSQYVFRNCTSLLVAHAGNLQLGTSVFLGCSKLHTIKGLVYLGASAPTDAFKGCVALRDVQFRILSNATGSVDLSDCPLLSLESVQSFLVNPANIAEVTITVHPDVYAKLTDTANTEWHKVLTDAAAKKISFATTSNE